MPNSWQMVRRRRRPRRCKSAVSRRADEHFFDWTWHLACSLTRWTRGVTAMQLPFTKEQFFDLFAAYNEALWPALIALWITPVVASLLLFSPRRPPDRWISTLLAAPWAWSGLAYHGRVLHAHQPGRMDLRDALPRAGRALRLGGNRAAAFVVRSHAQGVGAGGVVLRRVLAAVSRNERRAACHSCRESPRSEFRAPQRSSRTAS